jgi:aminodeoxyfutalosine synthase
MSAALPTRDELLALAAADLETLRERADAIRAEVAGDIVRYNVNRHIEPTNICRFACTFCSFARHRITQPGAFRYSVEEILERTLNDDERGITEYHIVGGVDLELGLDYYVALIGGLSGLHPQILIKALSAVEIGDLARRSKTTYEDVLTKFRNAGAKAITGGGAEIFSQRVRKRISATKIDGEQWLEIHATAHRVGLHSNATMLFGHLETMEERVDHILAVRGLQERTKGFGAFIPLPFIPFDDTRMSHFPAPTREDYLRTIALSRIALPNFGTIKAYWPAAGIENAREALKYGANDLDGTITEETIYHTNESPVTQGGLEAEIRSVGRVPVER